MTAPSTAFPPLLHFFSFLFFLLLSAFFSLSHLLPWLEIHPGDSTPFPYRIYLCVHNLSSAPRLYILLAFCVVGVSFLVVVWWIGHTEQRRVILTHQIIFFFLNLLLLLSTMVKNEQMCVGYKNHKCSNKSKGADCGVRV